MSRIGRGGLGENLDSMSGVRICEKIWERDDKEGWLPRWGGGGGRKQIKNQIVAFSKILSTKNDCYVKLPIISKI